MSVPGAGGFSWRPAATASQTGGNPRLGPEDSLFTSRGKTLGSNARQVPRIRRLKRQACPSRSPRPHRCLQY
ncbi:MAG: 3-keto-5-aminohexanoate cleavage protein [Rhodobacter sp.]|nr:3-keto-5-aminohexanoate cleavage protein [Rhodobacter sp.]